MLGYSSELKEPPAGRRRNRLEGREAAVLSLPTSLVQLADVRQAGACGVPGSVVALEIIC